MTDKTETHIHQCPDGEPCPPHDEPAIVCPAGLLPLGDGPVDRCVETIHHDEHRTANGRRWTDTEL